MDELFGHFWFLSKPLSKYAIHPMHPCWMVLPGPGGQADDDMPMVELKQEVSEDHGGPQSSSQATFCLNIHN